MDPSQNTWCTMTKLQIEYTYFLAFQKELIMTENHILICYFLSQTVTAVCLWVTGNIALNEMKFAANVNYVLSQ